MQSYANGSVQQKHIAKEEGAVPTLSLDSVFITSTIDAEERRKVVTIDIPGAFLHATYEDCVIMRMNGMLEVVKVRSRTFSSLVAEYLVGGFMRW